MIKPSDGYPIALAIAVSAGLAAFAAGENYNWNNLFGDLMYFTLPLLLGLVFLMCLVNCLYQVKCTGFHRVTLKTIKHPLLIMLSLLIVVSFYYCS